MRRHIRNICQKYGAKNAIHLMSKCYISDELPRHLLTNREYELMDILITGKNTEQAASIMTISSNTVRTHRKNILEKYETNSIRRVLAILINVL